MNGILLSYLPMYFDMTKSPALITRPTPFPYLIYRTNDMSCANNPQTIHAKLVQQQISHTIGKCISDDRSSSLAPTLAHSVDPGLALKFDGCGGGLI